MMESGGFVNTRLGLIVAELSMEQISKRHIQINVSFRFFMGFLISNTLYIHNLPQIY